MAETKFYLLYNNKAQDKFISMASSLEKITEESQFHENGAWFEYDMKEDSSFLFNEKYVKGIEFPKEPKKREYGEFNPAPKAKFKWLN